MTPWARDRRRIRALQGQVQPFAMISLRERQCFHLPLQGALTWVVRVPRVPFTSPPARFILPWARFLLPLWGVLVQLCCPCCLCCPGCRLYFLHNAHKHIGCLRMGFHGNKDDYLKKPPFYSSKKSFGKSPTFPTPIPQSSCIYWKFRV